MGPKTITWCFGLKDGLRMVEPNETLARSYLEEARSSLERAEKNFKDGDLLWTTVVVYYAEYYALYSFLQKIGMKCENHLCSILAVGILLGEDKINTINDHKGKRIDAQYYMKVGKGEQVNSMLQEAKIFVVMFDEIVANLTQNELNDHREKLRQLSLPTPHKGRDILKK